ncbi:MAG: glutamine--fructose-6-phosphate transaminase (isomerizing) [Nevskiaceae bacterium]|nr:MAG: glutamine--fructose-6-phosphate transaminase (isomerizing) [Nevskiaceae bacterium]
MCGLVGVVAQKNVTPFLVDALRRLEYRGYDSAGVAVLDNERGMTVRRRVGKVSQLRRSLGRGMVSSRLGIGHTRWATHGEPAERNAHPHVSGDDVAVVHNGIIENYDILKGKLESRGYEFLSETDSEVIAHLIHYHLAAGNSLFVAVQKAVRELCGAYAIAVLSVQAPDTLVVARSGSTLVLGIGESEQFVASDVTALLQVTHRFMFLEEGDVAEIKRGDINIVDANGHVALRPVKELQIPVGATDKSGYRHFMLKEIHEQPRALAATLEGRIAGEALLGDSLGFRARNLLERIQNVQIAACGTSHHAGRVARYWIEAIAGIPCGVELASEYRYRSPVVVEDSLFIGISQSGETADTLAALRYAQKADYLATLSICNVPESSLVRESDLSLLTHAGPELGVASTKAFTTQLLSLLMLTGVLARRHGGRQSEREIVRQLRNAAGAVEAVLKMDDAIATVAGRIAARRHALFLGRGPFFPIAEEGALKLKEISYIHAEAYAAGELKHGPLALVDAEMPVIAVAPRNGWIEKVKSNLREVSARGGELFVFTDDEHAVQAGPGVTVIAMPAADELIAPITYAVALQLLAYYTALIRGTDVDRPRNLAKSVTVE